MRRYRELTPTFPDPADWTLPKILRERAQTHADRSFLEVPFQDVAHSFAETLEISERIAANLVGDGLHHGDRLVIMASNCVEYVLAWFGSACAGIVEVPMNTAYKGSFLEHQVRTTAPRAVVAEPEFVAHFLDGNDAYRTVEIVYVLGEGAETEAALEAVAGAGLRAFSFSHLTDPAPAGELPEVSERDLSAIFFTSGTTGLSKGVMMSHAQLAFFADQDVSLCRLTSEDCYMSVGPLFHGNAQFLAVYPALIAGCRVIVQKRFSATRWLDQIRSGGVTVTNLVGVMMDFVFNQPPTEYDGDNRLRCCYSVPTATSILPAFRERFGVEAFVESFGSTEASLVVMAPYAEARPAGAAGLLVDEWFEVRVVDPETDRDVESGQTGELITRARQPWTMFSGYYGMPEKTLEAFRNLWFHTGDAVRCDDDGWYYFVDRLKDAIRRRGENISSYEVEQAVMEHPRIEEVAAVAAPSGVEGGEDEIAIFVVAVEGETLTEAEVRSWCEERLPAFAEPKIVQLIDELPYTPSGKVRKVALRELLATA
ncbi:MAG TPA: AMP-binding protein [Solirubrobacteraceae bacterium]|nr:AMP-binding protein [Solirubrobacteraceae bacterium]